MPLPDSLRPKLPGPVETGTPAAPRPETYEVKKGDALIKIARKFDMTAAQLKQFNELKDDRIQHRTGAADSHAGAIAHFDPAAAAGTEKGSRREEENRKAG